MDHWQYEYYSFGIINWCQELPKLDRKTSPWITSPKGRRRSLVRSQKTGRKGPDAVRKGPDAVRKGPDAVRKRPDAVRKGPDAVRKGPDAVRKGPDAVRKSLPNRNYKTGGICRQQGRYTNTDCWKAPT